MMVIRSFAKNIKCFIWNGNSVLLFELNLLELLATIRWYLPIFGQAFFHPTKIHIYKIVDRVVAGFCTGTGIVDVDYIR